MKILFCLHDRRAVQDCPSEESDPDDNSRVELQQKNLEAKHANIRELIGKCFIWSVSDSISIGNSNAITQCHTQNVY